MIKVAIFACGPSLQYRRNSISGDATFVVASLGHGIVNRVALLWSSENSTFRWGMELLE